jgi:hypothetical protein
MYRRPWRSIKGSEEGRLPPASSLVLWVDTLDMEPRVTSIVFRGPEGAADVEDAEMVLPRASVAVSHCFASTFGGIEGLVTFVP